MSASLPRSCELGGVPTVVFSAFVRRPGGGGGGGATASEGGLTSSSGVEGCDWALAPLAGQSRASRAPTRNASSLSGCGLGIEVSIVGDAKKGLGLSPSQRGEVG